MSQHASPPAPPEATLADYGRVLRRRLALIVGFTLLGLVASVAYLAVAPKSYQSTAIVAVHTLGSDNQSTNGNGNRTIDNLNLDTEAQLVRSVVVATEAGKALATSTTPTALVKKVAVTVPANTTVLNISFTARTAGAAQRGAHAFAQAYLDNRATTAKASTAAEVGALQNQLTSLNAQLKDATAIIASLPATSPDRQLAQSRQTLVLAQITNINAQLTPLIADPVNAGAIVTDAGLPSAAASPKKSLVGGSGVVAGLLLGILAAAWAQRRDPRVHGWREVEQVTGLPVLVEPAMGRRTDLRELTRPTSEASRALDELRNIVAAATSWNGGAVLVITAGTSTSGSGVAAGLAAAFARADGSAMLVCAAAADSRAASLLEVPAYPGFSDALSGARRPADTMHDVSDVPGLQVIPPGKRPSKPVDNPMRAVHELVRQLRGSAHYVVLEGPPVADGAGAQALAPLADHVLLVVNDHRSTAAECTQAVRQLANVNAKVLGIVLLPVGAKERPPARGAGVEVREKSVAPATPRSVLPQQPAFRPAED